MNIYGYHRVSKKEQHLDRGITEINEFCENQKMKLTNIYKDKHTGRTFDRPRYTVLKEDVLRSGDILIITEADRLGRNKQETLKELQGFKEKNIRIMILELPTTLIDISILDNELSRIILETVNNMLIEMYTTMAQAEMEKRVKRQKEGIQEMKKRGEWEKYGRPCVISQEEFKKEYQRVLNGSIKPFELMRELKMTKSTFYRYKSKIESC